MSIQLNAQELQLRAEIEDRVQKARQFFSEARIGPEVSSLIQEAGVRAHDLHMLLKRRGHEPKHHAYMIKNRELSPDHPEFYMHLHPLEDLLKFLVDEHANDDPEDVTVGGEFEFKVFSRRWGHDDTYKVRRTKDGWEIRHMAIGGPCDKAGRPFLFENFRQDSINFPSGLEDWMEQLWELAASKGLSQGEVQAGLSDLAKWVSTTEQHAPSGGLWEG